MEVDWFKSSVTSIVHMGAKALFGFFFFEIIKILKMQLYCFSVLLLCQHWTVFSVCHPFCRIIYPIHYKWVNPIQFIPFVSLLGNLQDGKLLGV